MWKHGELSGFKWCIKVFEVGSEFGIDNGRISKLWIQRKSNEETVANYSRGWDVKPFDNDVKEVYEELIAKYN